MAKSMQLSIEVKAQIEISLKGDNFQRKIAKKSKIFWHRVKYLLER